MGVTFSGGFNGIIKKIGNAIKLTIKAHFIFLCEHRFEFFLNRKYSCSLVIRSKLGQRPSARQWTVGTVSRYNPIFLVSPHCRRQSSRFPGEGNARNAGYARTPRLLINLILHLSSSHLHRSYPTSLFLHHLLSLSLPSSMCFLYGNLQLTLLD
jgi:hypothetical protein